MLRVQRLAAAGVGSGALALTVAMDGRLYAASPKTNIALGFGGTDATKPGNPAVPKQINLANNQPAALAAAGDGAHVYVACAAISEVAAIKASDLSVVMLPIGTAGTTVASAVAVASTTGGDVLGVVDAKAKAVYVVSANPDAAKLRRSGDPDRRADHGICACTRRRGPLSRRLMALPARGR